MRVISPLVPHVASISLAASEGSGRQGGLGPSIGTPVLWGGLIIGVIVLLVVDFVVTRKPHEVSMKEATYWSIFYIALPLLFGVFLWVDLGSQIGLEFLTGYVVEKSLSVDNLFVFILLLSAFAVPKELQQRVLLYGIIGALVLRAIFIALGAAALSRFDWVFLIFGLILVATAVKVLRDAMSDEEEEIEVDDLKVVQVVRKVVPVTSEYEGPKVLGRVDGKRAITPFALVCIVVLATDVVFAVDSVPAVFGITGDAYLVFATNAFALLGLRALYFVLEGALSQLVHLGYGLAAILAFIGAKLVLHWGHLVNPSVPEVPTVWSLVVVVGILAVVTATSLYSTKRRAPEPDHDGSALHG